jgi:hypothetical protein
MKKITLSLLLFPMLLMGVAPVINFLDTTVTTTTGTVESAGAGSTADLGTESTTTTDAAIGDNYTATPLDDTIVYTPNLTDQNDIFGQAGDDVIKPTDSELEDYYGQYYGEDGNDYIELTWGTWSEAYGGAGDDTLVGHRDADNSHSVSGQYFYGGDGDDKIYAPGVFGDNSNRIYGDAGFDVMVVYGTSADYNIIKSWGRYYLEQISTGKDLRFQDIEKIIFSTDLTPNLVGAEEGETFYFDNSTTLSTTPTTTSDATLTTVTLYEHNFSLTTTAVAGGKIYIDMISDKIFSVTDTTTGIVYEVLGRNITDDNENILGQTGYLYLPITADVTRTLVMTGEVQLTTTEITDITVSAVLPGF